MWLNFHRSFFHVMFSHFCLKYNKGSDEKKVNIPAQARLDGLFFFWSCFSTCHCKDADPDVQVPPSNHCHFTAIPGALLLLMFGLPGRPDPRTQHDHVEHPYGDESRPVYRHPPYQWAQMMTESWYIPFQVKLLPKCNLGFFFFFFVNVYELNLCVKA